MAFLISSSLEKSTVYAALWLIRFHSSLNSSFAKFLFGVSGFGRFVSVNFLMAFGSRTESTNFLTSSANGVRFASCGGNSGIVPASRASRHAGRTSLVPRPMKPQLFNQKFNSSASILVISCFISRRGAESAEGLSLCVSASLCEISSQGTIALRILPVKNDTSASTGRRAQASMISVCSPLT